MAPSIWLHGPSGVGKTATARDWYPCAFTRSPHQSWDDFFCASASHEYVLLDDLGMQHAGLGPLLRRLCDGGSVVCVTSVYTPDQIWGEKNCLDSILRRFSLISVAEYPHNIECPTHTNHRVESIVSVPSTRETVGLWLYGPTGCGKTRTAELWFPDAYMKSLDSTNWAGFRPHNIRTPGLQPWHRAHDVIVIDDFCPDHACLGHDLRRWVDVYESEITVQSPRGQGVTSTCVNFSAVCVTSMYRPDQIWRDASELACILRRFRVVEIAAFPPTQQKQDFF